MDKTIYCKYEFGSEGDALRQAIAAQRYPGIKSLSIAGRNMSFQFTSDNAIYDVVVERTHAPVYYYYDTRTTKTAEILDLYDDDYIYIISGPNAYEALQQYNIGQLRVDVPQLFEPRYDAEGHAIWGSYVVPYNDKNRQALNDISIGVSQKTTGQEVLPPGQLRDFCTLVDLTGQIYIGKTTTKSRHRYTGPSTTPASFPKQIVLIPDDVGYKGDEHSQELADRSNGQTLANRQNRSFYMQQRSCLPSILTSTQAQDIHGGQFLVQGWQQQRGTPIPATQEAVSEFYFGSRLRLYSRRFSGSQRQCIFDQQPLLLEVRIGKVTADDVSSLCISPSVRHDHHSTAEYVIRFPYYYTGPSPVQGGGIEDHGNVSTITSFDLTAHIDTSCPLLTIRHTDRFATRCYLRMQRGDAGFWGGLYSLKQPDIINRNDYATLDKYRNLDLLTRQKSYILHIATRVNGAFTEIQVPTKGKRKVALKNQPIDGTFYMLGLTPCHSNTKMSVQGNVKPIITCKTVNTSVVLNKPKYELQIFAHSQDKIFAKLPYIAEIYDKDHQLLDYRLIYPDTTDTKIYSRQTNLKEGYQIIIRGGINGFTYTTIEYTTQ